ncbi:MAG: ATP-binding protein [Candidatus Cloacimonadales bacterium]
MKRKRLKLQQQIFLSFFLVVVSLVIIQFFFTWYLFSFGIKQTENDEINQSISKVDAQLELWQNALSQELNDLISKPEFIAAFQTADQNKISQILATKPAYKNLLLFDKQEQLIYGSNWNLSQKYISEIQQLNSRNIDTKFYAEHSYKLYLMLGNTLQDADSLFIGSALYVTQLRQEIFTPAINLPSQIVPVDSQHYSSGKLELPEALFRTELQEMLQRNSSRNILRQNRDSAFGFYLLNDVFNQAQAVVLLGYPREMNSFFSSGVIFFALIILAFSLVIASFMGIWFSKSIMQPVKDISAKMTEISQNPSHIKPFRDKFSGVLGDITDIYSDMSRSLIESRKILLQYKAITDHINVGIFFMNAEHEIVICNPAFQKIFALETTEKINLSELTQISSQKLLEIGNSPTHNYYFSLQRNGQKKYLILDLNISREADELKYFGSITDETTMVKSRKAKQSLELELIKSNRLAKIGNLLVGVVHNLNSPLNSIIGYSQFLKKDFPDNTDIDRLHQSAQQVSTMVKGLLNKNRNENRSMPQNIDVNEVINAELEMCEHNLFFKHYVIVKKQLSENLKFTNAVYSDISLCLANLLNNAIDAMHDSDLKELNIKSFMRQNLVVIEICDTGCGIAEDKLEEIFDISYSSKLDDKSGGYGLGLALTKAIVEKCQGKIEVESKLDVGSCFRVSFPKM